MKPNVGRNPLRVMSNVCGKAFLIGCFCVAIAGCKDNAGDAVAMMSSFRDRMCACKDSACAEGVSAEVGYFLSRQGTTTQPTKAQEDQMTKIGDQLTACLQSIASSPGGH